ncbi:MAG: ABC transporter permease [Candidatus Riflebacteria bacterium]|nr:ABC transporter permease [Candidatus Riflebacteria bacterium]
MTQVIEGFIIGLAGLTTHMTRSLLTMLGIIVGVAAVIAMMAIGSGAKEETRRQIEAYGATTLFVRSVKLPQEKLQKAKRALSVGLAVSDGEYLQEIFPFVVGVAPEAMFDEKIRYRGREPKGQLVGVDPRYFSLTGQQTTRGRLLLQQDVDEFRRVCVLGPQLARELFVQEDALGKSVRVGSLRLTVVGVTRRSMDQHDEGAPRPGQQGQGNGALAIKSREVARDLYIPISLMLTAFPRFKENSDSDADPTYHRIKELIVKVDRPQSVAVAKQAITKVLLRRHGQADDFEVVAPLEILEQSKKAQEIFNLVMALIAGLSLVVGGIGIMNIMLATVTERTREIGVRRAMGATQMDILIQFLMEATVISVTGGLLGIVMGVGIARIVGIVLGWRTITTVFSIALAFGVSVVVGILFGLFPARVAAQMDPIAALRYE